MNGTLKNIVVLGTMVLIIFIFIGAYQIQLDSETKSNAIKRVLALAETNAKSHIKSGNIVLLAASHGWGPNDIPSLDMSLYDSCVSEAVELKVYREYSDVHLSDSREEKFRRYSEDPESTYEYAFQYNQFILEHLKNIGAVKCI